MRFLLGSHDVDKDDLLDDAFIVTGLMRPVIVVEPSTVSGGEGSPSAGKLVMELGDSSYRLLGAATVDRPLKSSKA